MKLLLTASGLAAVARVAATNVPLHFQVSNNEPGYGLSTREPGWQLQLDPVFDILGPFPQHAREQHYLNPLYPLDSSDLDEWTTGTRKQYYSSLVENGMVGWSNATLQDGNLAVAYPTIDWKALRRTEGWAGLQHHTLAHSKLVLTPIEQGESCTPPMLQAELRQVSFFAISPEITANHTLKWHAGNIYDLARAPMGVMPFPTAPKCNETTVYHIFASLDYEIRLFGDPLDVEKSEAPIHRSSLKFSTIDPSDGIRREPKLDLIPDLVDGWLFSEGFIGLGFMCGNQSWELASIESTTKAFHAGSWLPVQVRLAPGQARVLVFTLHQIERYTGDSVSLLIRFRDSRGGAPSLELDITIPMVQKPAWTVDSEYVYKGTYLLAGTPTYYMAKPPIKCDPQAPVVVALHGAGVEADHPVWTSSVRRQSSSWVVFPTGGTPWGLDWHGISAKSATSSLQALRATLHLREAWNACPTMEQRMILIGHSNGGQGVWYIASRFPSGVLAAVPAAAYIKSQQYVSTGLSHGAHFADVTLRAILDATLQPDDNDLFLTNLVSTPILAVHGGNDRNVPTWHSRELVSVVKHWYPNANVSFHEVPNKPHWWNEVLASQEVQNFIDGAVANLPSVEPPSQLTVTTALPSESGHVWGISIAQMSVPGRLGRIFVSRKDDKLFISTANVQIFNIRFDLWEKPFRLEFLEVDGVEIASHWVGGEKWFIKKDNAWEPTLFPTELPRLTGPMSQILSNGPLFIIIPRKQPKLLDMALRISFNLLTYLRVDSQVMFDDDESHNLNRCVPMMIFGGRENKFGESILAKRPSEFKFTDRGWTLRGHEYSEPGLGVAFLHPHRPRCSQLTLFTSATDDAGWERILRLLPLRTGIATPEWIITGPNTDRMGVGGLLGAGYVAAFRFILKVDCS